MAKSKGTEWHKTHPLPGAEFVGKKAIGVAVDGYGVATWCPTPDGSGKPEKVILHFDVELADGKPPLQFMKFMIGFTSRAEVNRCIAALLRHADEVWPEPKA